VIHKNNALQCTVFESKTNKARFLVIRPSRNLMAETPFDNIYDLTSSQLERLDEAEDLMLKNDLGAAERLLLSMLEEDEECIPVLSNLGHLYGRHLSEFETAVSYYDKVLHLEPDNAWARDARRRYMRFVGK